MQPETEKPVAAMQPETEKPVAAKVERQGSKGPIDRDPRLWHNRQPSSQVVKDHAVAQEEAKKSRGAGQGIWPGVIFPCTANILGVILFLRAPWIVGKAGIANAFGLVFVCCTCTFVTTLSLSAVATNGKIMAGGSYYLISRSMGPALGAGVGLCFYMANSIGAAMYFMGTVEAWEIAQPDYQILEVGDINNIRLTAFCILGAAVCVVGGGIKYVVRLGTFFLFVVLGVIVCMYLGCFIGPDQFGTGDSVYDAEITVDGKPATTTVVWGGIVKIGEYFSENIGEGWDVPQAAFPLDVTQYDFVSMMGLWFPACTGIMAGSNRSADLADPSASIPKGTLTAQLFTSFLYLSFIVLYGVVAPRRTLLDDKFFAATSAWPLKEVVIYGVMASSIGAGLTSLVSGTRLLSAIAGDKTLPILRFFAAKPGQEPRLALLASGALCACAIAIGELNAVAPILTMFFLMCYTCVNASCTIAEALQDPNWRPSFRFHHWSISLFGMGLCIWMMFAISAIQAMIAIVFCSLVMCYSAFNSHAVKWGDGFQGMKFQVARNILMKIDSDVHTKNWRPQMLVITRAAIRSGAQDSDEPGDWISVEDPELLKFVSQLKGGRGITIVGGVCSSHGVPVFSEGGMFLNSETRHILIDGQAAMSKLLKQNQIEGFGHLMYSEHFAEGLQCLVQTAGLGSFQPNCIMTAWPEAWSAEDKTGATTRTHLIRLIQMGVVFNKAVLMAKGVTWPALDERLDRTIDIWWIVGDGGILLLLPFLLKKHRVWQTCRTRLFVLAEQALSHREMMQTQLEMYVKDFRLDIEVHVKVISSIAPAEESQAVAVDQNGAANGPPERQTSGSGDSGAASQNVHDIDVYLEGTANDLSCTVDGNNTQASKRLSGFTMLDLQRTISGSVDSSKGDEQEPARAVSGGSFTPPPKRNISTDDSKVFPRMVSAPAALLGRRGSTEGADDASNGLSRQTSGGSVATSRPPPQFLTSEHQLVSMKPCNPAELVSANRLSAVILEESMHAELVVANLPDMAEEESAYGYCQLIEAMTQGLPRCLLVRGTANEVITQFT